MHSVVAVGIKSFAVGIALLMVVAPRPVAADGLLWHLFAFDGERVNAVAVGDAGRVVYLSTDQGLQVSDDGGETWLCAWQDLAGEGAPPVVTLAVDPRDPRTAYAGTDCGSGAGLYVTHDLGLHWQRIFAGPGQGGIRSVAVSPTDPDVILASAVQ